MQMGKQLEVLEVTKSRLELVFVDTIKTSHTKKVGDAAHGEFKEVVQTNQMQRLQNRVPIKIILMANRIRTFVSHMLETSAQLSK